MTASQIQRALRARHSKDLYIEECKNGPTQVGTNRLLKLDGWAFLRTWSPVTSVGYEVKVARSDFINDNKWPDYLRLCHLFYFVAPKGLIDLSELPEGVGLIEVIGKPETPRLTTRRKSAYHQPGPEYLNLLHYVLMCRTSETPEYGRAQRIAEWREWIKLEHDAKSVGRKARFIIQQQLRAADDRVRRAEARAQGYERVQEILRELGFDPKAPVHDWGLRKQLEKAIGVLTPEVMESLERAQSSLNSVVEQFKTMRGAHECK